MVSETKGQRFESSRARHYSSFTGQFKVYLLANIDVNMGENEVIYDWLQMAIVGGIICLFGMGNANAQTLTRQQIIDMNTRPAAEVNVAGESMRGVVVSAAMTPAQRYDASCAFCHDTGTAGSPKIGVKAAWQPRLAKGGIEALIHNAIVGIGTMPPKGMCPSCTDEEIAAAVQYMVDKSS